MNIQTKFGKCLRGIIIASVITLTTVACDNNQSPVGANDSYEINNSSQFLMNDTTKTRTDKAGDNRGNIGNAGNVGNASGNGKAHKKGSGVRNVKLMPDPASGIATGKR